MLRMCSMLPKDGESLCEGGVGERMTRRRLRSDRSMKIQRALPIRMTSAELLHCPSENASRKDSKYFPIGTRQWDIMKPIVILKLQKKLSFSSHVYHFTFWIHTSIVCEESLACIVLYWVILCCTLLSCMVL